MNGLKIQWGVESGTKTAQRTIRFPIEFSTGNKPAVSGSIVNNDSWAWCSIHNITRTGFTASNFYRSGNAVYNNGTGPLSWLAIGY